ncbi:MAG: 4Fe-4S binding protein [Treponema sp.]|jgi:NADH-quinone oxidoreductase subunit F|nr:4Fe-4S binding protein [Treponema sp.]
MDKVLSERTLLICCGTGCIAGGAKKTADALEKAAEAMIKSGKLKIKVNLNGGIKTTGCNGFCENGPIVRIMPDDISYYRVKPADAEEIINHIAGTGGIVERLLYTDDTGKKVHSQKENPFYAQQHKITLGRTGLIEPGNIKDYIAYGGFEALKKALSMSPDKIIEEIEKSGLRGRGGAGFPTGRKWRQCAGYEETPKYVVCNGDEGDPGAFMDRSILEGDPHSVIEGLCIAARAIGAAEGFMYIRDEYDLAQKNVHKALETARAEKYLGKNILGSGWDFDISVVRGGGAFVCGESSALMASIEGRVGEPRTKYIRSVQRGLWDKPTVLNNVETLANIPCIISMGGVQFKKTGTEASPGTKVFALVGKVKRTGLVEVPMGTTLRQLVFDIGGGILGKREFKAVQTGGPSGGCIPASLLDLPLDFETLDKYGSMMGSGGVIVMDDRTCMVEIARYYTKFLAEESCGKCTPCREGLKRMLEILSDLTAGKGREGDIESLEETGITMKEAALCGLGKSAPNPVLTTIKYYKDEYEAHLKNNVCPAGVCAALTSFSIQKDLCKGCGICRKSCPVSAVSGEKNKAHSIDKKLCISCGTCRNDCPFGAIDVKGRKS